MFSQVLVFFRHFYFHWSCSLSFVAEAFFPKSYDFALYQKLAKVSKVRESFFSMHDYFVFIFNSSSSAKLTILKTDYGNGFLRVTHFPKSENNEQS